MLKQFKLLIVGFCSFSKSKIDIIGKLALLKNSKYDDYHLL